METPATSSADVPPKQAPDMKLLKIRNQFINIDLLESVLIEKDVITISIAGNRYIFAGDEATILKEWFDQYAFDLMNHHTISIHRTASKQSSIKTPSVETASIEALHSQVRALGLFRKPFVLD